MWAELRRRVALSCGPDTAWLLLFVVVMLVFQVWFRSAQTESYQAGKRVGAHGLFVLSHRARSAIRRP